MRRLVLNQNFWQPLPLIVLFLNFPKQLLVLIHYKLEFLNLFGSILKTFCANVFTHNYIADPFLAHTSILYWIVAPSEVPASAINQMIF